MATNFKKYLLGVFLALGFAQSFASPLSTLETAANNVIHALQKNKTNLKTNRSYVYSVVNRYIIPLVDKKGMARSVLGRNAWRKATTAQRTAFTECFINLVVRTYSTALRDYSGEKVKFFSIRGRYNGKKFIKIKSLIIKSSGKNIPIIYSLVNKSGSWRVYDMSVEGVSLLQSYKSQFAQYLASHDMNQLIAKLKK